MSVRPATAADTAAIVRLVRDLAAYERSVDSVQLTEPALDRALYAPMPAVFCHVAVDDTGSVVGLALWFLSFSTWVGRHGIYLEDLYVTPVARQQGHGRALLRTLATVCVERGYGRLDWAVLDWNADAQAFYRSVRATPLAEWTGWRLDGEELIQLAAVG